MYYHPLLALASCLLPSIVLAQQPESVTVYGLLGQTIVDPNNPSPTVLFPSATTSFVTTPGPPSYTELAAYNPIYYAAPPNPDPPPPNAFAIGVPMDGAKLTGLSVNQIGCFLGFSIEMSVANQLIGSSSIALKVPFLNFVSIIAAKAGCMHIRVGGNTQDYAYLVPELADGRIIEKNKEDASGPTGTPVLAITYDFLYMLANVSSLVNVRWYLGIPFNDTNWRLQIAEKGEEILGDRLIGFQMANEPDLYAAHFHRDPTYSPKDFFDEFGQATQAYLADNLVTNKNNLIAPSVSSAEWSPEQVWETGFVETYGQFLSHLAVEHYPNDNCAVIFPNPNNPPKDPLELLPRYLSHNSAIEFSKPYLNSAMLAQQWNKPFMLFETNTGSCGGFPGISDAFTSALWGIDHAMQLAHSNFTGGLLHFGGQNVSYNPFTAAPTNISNFAQWTAHPLFYSIVFLAETMGKSNATQVRDMMPNDGNEKTVAYAVYENGKFARMAMINYMDDPTGGHDYTATIYVGGTGFGEENGAPASVKVKYLLAPSVGEKDNVTWAGQTLGGRFKADGRWQGEEDVKEVQCDQTQNMCQIKVPAPGAALVFFSDEAKAAIASGDDIQTHPTTYITNTKNTVKADPSAVAISNGENGKNRQQHNGGTSFGNGGNGAMGVVVPSVAVLGSLIAGVFTLRRMAW